MLFVVEIARRGRGQHSRRLGNNGSVADHASDFFDEVFRDGNIFRGAPAWDREQQFALVDHVHAKDERLENIDDLFRRKLAAQLALGPIDIELDFWRR